MKAIIYGPKPGDEGEYALQYTTHHTKPIPKKGEALVRITVAGICATDLEIMKGYFKAFNSGSIVLGHEFVGVVEAININSDDDDGRIKVGTRVVGDINFACRKQDCWYCAQERRDEDEVMHKHCPDRVTLGIVHHDGVMTEYQTMPIRNLVPVPGSSIPDEVAVFAEPLAAALQVKVEIGTESQDEPVAVFGVGRLGFLSSLCLAMAGRHVYVFDKSEERVKRAVEAHQNIHSNAYAPSEKFGFVVDCTGHPSGFHAAIGHLRPRGTLILKSTFATDLHLNISQIVVDEFRIIGSRCGSIENAIQMLTDMSKDAHEVLKTLLHEKRYTLEDYSEAFDAAMETGEKVLFKMT